MPVEATNQQSTQDAIPGPLDVIRETAASLWTEQRPKADLSWLAKIPAEDTFQCRLAVHDCAAEDPLKFCAGALYVLNTEPQNPIRSYLIEHLLRNGVLIVPLSDPLSFGRWRAIVLGQALAAIDSLLDEKILDRIGDGSTSGFGGLNGLAVERALEIFAAISDGARLERKLAVLLEHPNPRIRSKAGLLLSRKKRDPEWAGQHTAMEADPRLRANIIEGLWGVDTEEARALLWDAVSDANSRVVANAVLGLHRLGERSVMTLLRRLGSHPSSDFRAAGAWAVGEAGDPMFLDILGPLVRDPSGQVRRNALRAMARIQEFQAANRDPLKP
jgi:hypothetical protein